MSTPYDPTADNVLDEKGWEETPAPNKAQPQLVYRNKRISGLQQEIKAQHSPLPWRVESGREQFYILAGSKYVTKTIGDDLEAEADARLIVASVNHADKLAEALGHLLRPLEHGWKVSDMDVRIKEAQAALAEYEKENQ